LRTALQDFINDFLPVLVIYQCPLSQSTTWQSATTESQRLGVTFDLLIYDNSTIPQLLPETSLTLHYVHDPANPGVSKAYNKGFQLAQQLNKKWLLFFDHDTSFPPGWIEVYAAAARFDHQNAIAPIVYSSKKIISPFNYWMCLGRSPKSMTPGIKSMNSFFAINSGLLVSTQLFSSAGGYDALIPMDFCDFAFMHRLKKINTLLNVIDLHVTHQLSSHQRDKIEKARERFKLYWIGSKRFGGYTNQPFLHFLVAIIRAVKLGVRYRTTGFLKIVLYL